MLLPVVAWLMAVAQGGWAQPSTPSLPVIDQQPQGGRAAVKETFAFRVEVSGTPPLTFQWYFKGSRISGATNQTLVQTNLTTGRSGRYKVRVENGAGRVESAEVYLTVSKDAPRELLIGAVSGTGPARIPIQLAGNGFENLVSFTLGFDGAAMANPIFVPENPGTTVQAVPATGRIGLTLQRPPGATFANTNQVLGTLQLDFLTATNPFQAGLFFTNEPTALVARDTNGLDLLLAAYVAAGLEIIGAAPQLNLQSGLFEQKLLLGNAGAAALTNTLVGVWGLGEDTQDEPITLFNSHTTGTVDTNGDGNEETNSYEVQIASLPAGQVLPLTMEYYVTDHLTVPTPQYFVRLPGSDSIKVIKLPSTARVVINHFQFVEGTFLIQFSTDTGYYYYIQYAPTAQGLNRDDEVKTATPKVRGTGGSVQWIDTGPPKTESVPLSASNRFYRVYRSDR